MSTHAQLSGSRPQPILIPKQRIQNLKLDTTVPNNHNDHPRRAFFENSPMGFFGMTSPDFVCESAAILTPSPLGHALKSSRGPALPPLKLPQPHLVESAFTSSSPVLIPGRPASVSGFSPGFLGLSPRVGPSSLKVGSHEVDVEKSRPTALDDEVEQQLEAGLVPSKTSVARSTNWRQLDDDLKEDEEDTNGEAGDEGFELVSSCRGVRKKNKQCPSQYNFLKLIGEGQFASVFLVEDKKTHNVYAMKVLKKKDVIKQKVVQHTKAERNVLVAIDHPFIVNLHSAFQTKSRLYLLMDYIPGGELYQRQPVKTEEEARFYIAEIILAIEHLHSRDIMYRDLKPENILIHSDGHVCLADLGLAKMHMTDDARANSFCGTPHYMAPECVHKKADYGKAADWWAVGIVLHELLQGNSPFHGKNRKKLIHNICTKKYHPPKRLTTKTQTFLRGLLQKSVKKRLGSTDGGVDAIKNHVFFEGLDWEKLIQKKIDPPELPQLKDIRDVTYFDSKFTSQTAGQFTPTSPAGSECDQGLFRGFSYTCSPTYGSAGVFSP